MYFFLKYIDFVKSSDIYSTYVVVDCTMKRNVVCSIVFVLLVGCSSSPKNPDPHEEFNRDALCFNLTLDQKVLKPVATGYETVTMEPIQRSVSSFLFNWKEPFYVVNYALQGNAERAANSLFRFFINTTIGFFGLFDVASELGLTKRETSHKETLKKWKVPTGDYLTLPILSSSSTRDAVAEPVSWAMDPVAYFVGWPIMLIKAIASAVDDRRINGKTRDEMIANSTDPYPLMRDIYLRTYGERPVDDDEDEE